jgi:hypothetical protein
VSSRTNSLLSSSSRDQEELHSSSLREDQKGKICHQDLRDNTHPRAEEVFHQTWDQEDQDLQDNLDSTHHKEETSTTSMDILLRDNQEDHQAQDKDILLTEDLHREDQEDHLLRDNSSDQDQVQTQVDQEVISREATQTLPEADLRTLTTHM